MKPSPLHEAGISVVCDRIKRLIEEGRGGRARLCGMVTEWPTDGPNYERVHEAASVQVGTGGEAAIQVAGRYPDLVVWSANNTVCAVGEIVVTNEPEEEKLARYKAAHIPVVICRFSGWRDLALYDAADAEISEGPYGSTPIFPAHLDKVDWFGRPHSHASQKVWELIVALRSCPPHYRIVLKELLDRLDTDESMRAGRW